MTHKPFKTYLFQSLLGSSSKGVLTFWCFFIITLLIAQPIVGGICILLYPILIHFWPKISLKIKLGIGILSFLITQYLFLQANLPQSDDFLNIYQGALSPNSHTTYQVEYFQNWPYQLNMVFFLRGFFTWIPAPYFFYLSNIFALLLISLGIHFILKNTLKDQSTSTILILISCFPAFFIRLGICGNDLWFLALGIWGCYFWNSTYKSISILTTALCISFAHYLRPEAVLLLLIILFITLIQKKSILKWLILTISTLFLGYLIQTIHKYFGAPYGNTTNTILWKFIVGLNLKTSGCYDESLTPLLRNHNLALEHLKQQITNISAIPLFIIKKMCLFWGRPDNILQFTPIQAPFTYSYSIWEKLCFAYLIRGIFLNGSEKIQYWLITGLFSYTLIYLFIEIAPRYKLILWPILIILYFYHSTKINNAHPTQRP